PRLLGDPPGGAGRSGPRRPAPCAQLRRTAADPDPARGGVVGLPRPAAGAVLFRGTTGEPRLGSAPAFRRATSHLRRPPPPSPGDHGSAGAAGQRAATRLWPGVHGMSGPSEAKVLRLRPDPPAADEPSTRMAIQVRTHLSLLQGYADIMEGLSPALKTQILGVMAEKTRALGAALQPFTAQAATARPDIQDYRRVRERTRHLMAEY